MYHPSGSPSGYKQERPPGSKAPMLYKQKLLCVSPYLSCFSYLFALYSTQLIRHNLVISPIPSNFFCIMNYNVMNMLIYLIFFIYRITSLGEKLKSIINQKEWVILQLITCSQNAFQSISDTTDLYVIPIYHQLHIVILIYIFWWLHQMLSYIYFCYFHLYGCQFMIFTCTYLQGFGSNILMREVFIKHKY